MRRRQALKTIGASAASLTLLTTVTSAGAAPDKNGGPQPLGGELPNDNVPEERVFAWPDKPYTVQCEAGTFLTLRNGWIGIGDGEMLESTRQVLEYDGQTFVLDSLDDWEKGPDNSVRFTHTDPPKPQGKTFEVNWNVIATDTFYDHQSDTTYQPGERFRPALFPLSNTFEVVKKRR